jgi:hypothetical protein
MRPHTGEAGMNDQPLLPPSWPLALLMGAMLLVFYADGFVVGASLPLALGFGLLGALVVVGVLRHANHGPMGSIRFATVLQAVLAAGAVLGLSRGLTLSVVAATALVGCVGGLLEAMGSQRWAGVGPAVYCGAFTGMTSELVLRQPLWVLLAAALAGVLLELLRHGWSGIGGKLGSTAFVAVVGVVGLATVCGAIGPGAQPYALKGAERLVVLGVALLSPQITFQLNNRFRLGPVLGSAIPGLVAALVLPAFLAGPWLGASFVGMTSPSRLGSHPIASLLVMGLLFALLLAGFEPSQGGLGGDLGATAAIAVFAVLGLQSDQ